ncbi:MULTISPECIES: hypothetical protein [Paraburkholderia]|jgi:hypothetical protein|uniref:hypothetical protein n=1 Tax=Paraburkholderia TaxID=1822464 RepID=UPI001CADC19E|nr:MULTISPECIES: hypothetical protein [Paraburkholderia]MDR6380644.1 hypothetical protein [Paraburkholderia caribensis]CAG9215129.1 hypothetical protein BCAR13_300139 [Paraburkholderia caribensis]
MDATDEGEILYDSGSIIESRCIPEARATGGARHGTRSILQHAALQAGMKAKKRRCESSHRRQSP